jgi:hypothetical protein
VFWGDLAEEPAGIYRAVSRRGGCQTSTVTVADRRPRLVGGLHLAGRGAGQHTENVIPGHHPSHHPAPRATVQRPAPPVRLSCRPRSPAPDG